MSRPHQINGASTRSLTFPDWVPLSLVSFCFRFVSTKIVCVACKQEFGTYYRSKKFSKEFKRLRTEPCPYFDLLDE